MPAKPGEHRNRSAMKRIRQAEKRRLRNRHVISTVKTAVKDVDTTLSSGNVEEAGKKLRAAIRKIDGACAKGVFHRNTASRQVSRLTKRFNKIASASA